MTSGISRELGRQEKESMQKILAITKEGFLLKQQLIQEAKRGIEDKKVTLGSQTWHLFKTGLCIIIFKKKMVKLMFCLIDRNF